MLLRPPRSIPLPYTMHFLSIQWQTQDYTGLSYPVFSLLLPPVGVLTYHGAFAPTSPPQSHLVYLLTREYKHLFRPSD